MNKFTYKQKTFSDKNLSIDGNHHIFEGIFRSVRQRKVAVGTFLLVEAWAEDPGLWADPFWETTGVAQAFSCLDLWRNQRVMLEEPERADCKVVHLLFLDILLNKDLKHCGICSDIIFLEGFSNGR